MGEPTPKIGTILTSEDGDEAMVVAEGTDPLTGLLDLVEESFGAARFSSENPAIQRVLPDVTIGVWRSCTLKWCEANGIDPDYEGVNGWWASDGDGKRSICVLAIPMSAYTLGEMAEEFEPEPVLAPQRLIP